MRRLNGASSHNPFLFILPIDTDLDSHDQGPNMLGCCFTPYHLPLRNGEGIRSRKIMRLMIMLRSLMFKNSICRRCCIRIFLPAPHKKGFQHPLLLSLNISRMDSNNDVDEEVHLLLLMLCVREILTPHDRFSESSRFGPGICLDAS